MESKNENKLVKYSNNLNKKVLLANLSGKEIDLFNAICIKIRGSESNITKISFEELKSLSDYTHKSKDRFICDIENTCTKILLANWSGRLPDNSWVGMTIFSSYKVDVTENWVLIKVNEDFLEFFNNLNNNITVFNIDESNNLKSKYSKIQHRYFRENEVNGVYKEKYSEFKIKMGVEDMPANDVTKRVLKSIKNELGEVFEELQVVKEKRGREIDELIWTWKESNDNPFEFFNDIFKFINVNFTHKIQCKLAEMQKEMDKEDIKNLIMEAWDIIKNSPKIKNPPAMMSKAITDVGLETFIKNSKEMEHKIKSNKESAKREQEWEKKKNEDSAEFIRDSDSYNKFQELPEDEKGILYSKAEKLFKEKTGQEIFGPKDNILTLMGLLPFIKQLMNQDEK